jgi:hypothetical protein
MYSAPAVRLDILTEEGAVGSQPSSRRIGLEKGDPLLSAMQSMIEEQYHARMDSLSAKQRVERSVALF